MTTIPLKEALERATPGPFEAYRREVTAKAGQFQMAYAFTNTEEDAAIIAHCRNELPGLVSAWEEYMRARNERWHHPNAINQKHAEDMFSKFEAALLSAQNVKLL